MEIDFFRLCVQVFLGGRFGMTCQWKALNRLSRRIAQFESLAIVAFVELRLVTAPADHRFDSGELCRIFTEVNLFPSTTGSLLSQTNYDSHSKKWRD